MLRVEVELDGAQRCNPVRVLIMGGLPDRRRRACGCADWIGAGGGVAEAADRGVGASRLAMSSMQRVLLLQAAVGQRAMFVSIVDEHLTPGARSPTRHGTHWPHDSFAEEGRRSAARATCKSTESSNTVITPGTDAHVPAARGRPPELTAGMSSWSGVRRSDPAAPPIRMVRSGRCRRSRRRRGRCTSPQRGLPSPPRRGRGRATSTRQAEQPACPGRLLGPDARR